MSPSFVHSYSKPHGTSLGMAIEASGSRIRLTSVTFDISGTTTSSSTQVFITPSTHKRTTAMFFDHVAYCIREFLHTSQAADRGASQGFLPLGISIGLPVNGESRVDEDAKEDSLGLLGSSNVMRRMCDAITRSHLPVRVTSVTNNTVGALVAANHADKDTQICVSFNHGINAAYFESLANVEYLAENTLSDTVAINTEIGRFGSLGGDNLRMLPLTMWDRRLDRESRKPGARILEKLVADQYLGELVRNLITDFMDRQLIFTSEMGEVKPISKEYAFHTAYMAPIMDDRSADLESVEAVFASEFGICNTCYSDRLVVRRLCEIVAKRASRLAGALLAALVQQQAGHCSCQTT
ncbi:hypothetical protein GGI15_004727 [Coemansia interrupta]|uniref:Phosphotransferase n=1 Tax=Coemansia interrupta TaxID=1126814 RepID=A0A9W8LER4_9FUNG|nr:hypothetical protein GGI15_004727 [Coemansia interrupta]